MGPTFLVIGQGFYSRALVVSLGLFGNVVRLPSVDRYEAYTKSLQAQRPDMHARRPNLFDTTAIFANLLGKSPSQQLDLVKSGTFTLRGLEFGGQILILTDVYNSQVLDKSSIVDDTSSGFCLKDTPGILVKTFSDSLLSIVLAAGTTQAGTRAWKEWLSKSGKSQLRELMKIEHPRQDVAATIQNLLVERINWISALGLDPHRPAYPAGFRENVQKLRLIKCDARFRDTVLPLARAIWDQATKIWEAGSK